MVGWVCLAVYLIGWFLTGRRLAWVLLDDLGGFSRGEDYVMSLVFGFMGALFWPVIVPAWLLWRFSPSTLFGKPKSVRREEDLERREQEVRERERRIADLEREVGIGGSLRNRV
jgi:hypothetical protein